MATLAEVRCNKQRERSFVGRPRPVRSGIALARVQPVAHRSEVLLDDQISLVAQTQDELEQAMLSLNNAQNDAELERWRSEVTDLKAKCEEMILILTVVAKLKAELMYAKLELEKISKAGGDIHEARRRVVWLEDRMESLLSRYRKMPRKKQPITENIECIDQPISTDLQHDTNSLSEKSRREKTPSEIERSISMADGLGDSREEGTKPERSILKHGAAESRGGGEGRVMSSGRRSSERRLSFGQATVTPTGSRAAMEAGPIESGSDEGDDTDVDDDDDNSDDDDDSDTEIDDSEDIDDDNERVDNAFITEGSLSALDSPVQLLPVPRDQGESDDEDINRDLAAEYWMSPHHRFEYSEQREVITRENPLSYHNLGLAVQSSFIEPAPPAKEELPWRPRRKGSDLPDVHKIALDKLSERIHKIWNKMEDATRKSIDCSTSQISEQKGSIIRQVESRLSEDSSVAMMKFASRKTSRGSQSSTKSAPLKEPAPKPKAKKNSQEGLPVVQLPKGRRTRMTPMVVYHPRPVPEPEMLPLTRTNPSKKFPRISSDWNETAQDAMSPTLRLVNQMNVAKETNLLVYKSKDKKRKSLTMSAAARQQKDAPNRRWKMFSNPAVTVAGIVAHVNTMRKGSTVKLDKDGLKWKRITEIMNKLTSERVDERRDAARHLGALDCSDRDILAALTKVVQNDSDDRVRYESAKSLVTLGFWSDHSLKVIVEHFEDGNYQVRSDLVKTLINSRNIKLANKASPFTKKLLSLLRDTCASKDSGDLGFDCAVCLGCLGVADPGAKKKLKGSLTSKDSSVISRSLEILVRQMNARDQDVTKMVLHQMQYSKSWKHRVSSAKLLVIIGCKHMKTDEEVQEVFNILERRLYDDPSKEVRSEIASTLTALELRDLATNLVEKRLEDDDDDNRAHAVIAVGVLGMKSDKIIRELLEMLDLDPCDYVRLQVIRTFAGLGLTNIKIMRALKERERSEGPLAKEASKSLKILNDLRSSQGSRSITRSPDRLRVTSK
ncbi:uncharacterized protein [Asterias amurensis]|uniref:uncharacterized protein isoform X2 n=1 Tax=Asterias amurensis TaxID=7602 RepID=UPI003AB7692B